jgi:Nucleoside diphosphate kinase
MQAMACSTSRISHGALPSARRGPLRSRVSAAAERSYVMVKPDGVQRGLVGQVIARFEAKGFQVRGLKMYQTPRDVAEEHYKDLSQKPFYGDLVDYIVSGPVVCIVRAPWLRQLISGSGRGDESVELCCNRRAYVTRVGQVTAKMLSWHSISQPLGSPCLCGAMPEQRAFQQRHARRR